MSPPPEIPKRESVSSASEIPSQASPSQFATHPLHAIPSMQLHSPTHSQLWGLSNGSSQALEEKPAESNYLDLYNLKQAQLEAAERSHRAVLEEVLMAREREEQLAERIQTELREEVRSVRRLEERLREKLEEQMRKEREIWNSEREMLLQKIKHLEDVPFAHKLKMREQENDSLVGLNEQLKNRMKMCELKGCSVNGTLSPATLEDFRFRGASAQNSSTVGQRSYSPSRRSFSPCGRLLSPSGRPLTGPVPTSRLTDRAISPSRKSNFPFHGNGTQSMNTADPYNYYGARRMTPNTLKGQEAPYSPPPSTIQTVSPPPDSYRRHAGHTPAASMSIAQTPKPERGEQEDLQNAAQGEGTETPTQENFASLSVAATGSVPVPAAELSKKEAIRKANEAHRTDMEAAANGDTPLKGPLGLKRDPEDSALFLNLLDKKLSDVSGDPNAPSHQPAVFRREEDDLSVISDNTIGYGEREISQAGVRPWEPDESPPSNSNGNGASKQPKQGENREEGGAIVEGKEEKGEKGDGDDDPPIRLRLKPSMNFGAPLGQISRRSESHDSF